MVTAGRKAACDLWGQLWGQLGKAVRQNSICFVVFLQHFGRPSVHQNSAPNCSQLGVFICVSRMTRGVPAHSACARGWSDTVPMAASSTLFCPLFSRNLCQLFRRSTRTSPCTTTSCACVDFSSSTTCLDEQTIRQTPSSGTRTASSTNPRVYGTPRALRRHGAGPRIAASLCRGASP